jgi:hypothetical protein
MLSLFGPDFGIDSSVLDSIESSVRNEVGESSRLVGGRAMSDCESGFENRYVDLPFVETGSLRTALSSQLALIALGKEFRLTNAMLHLGLVSVQGESTL